ncbi:mitogen-activated protein kinase kinase kinase 14 [Denticeps clupeoides]|uniref:Protein kinase domain-containing protein n=1 Tax=Denticeps clupeoides TaxID=299321 RepID=A0AAY4CYY4_9TELE|nr:mitogen-activated protein kinase kinase kinase 14-like [Denticeps clupeoides]
MAVMPQLLSSTLPFSGCPIKDLKGVDIHIPSAKKDPGPCGEDGVVKEGGDKTKPSLQFLIHKVFTQGTAEPVGSKEQTTSLYISQAECEAPDSQVLTPSGSEHSYARDNSRIGGVSYSHAHSDSATSAAESPTPSSSRKKRRKRTRRCGSRLGGPEDGLLTSIPEQESGDLSYTQVRGPDFGSADSSLAQDTGGLHFQHWPRSYLSYSQDQEGRSDSSLSSVGDCSLAVKGLRNSVSQGDRCYVGDLCKEMARDGVEEEGEEECASDVNEGLLLNEQLQPVDYEYREGRDYSTQPLKNGSYGDVYLVKDANTGFVCAAKKIPLSRFRSDEVTLWNRLHNLPTVIQLFGAVRERNLVILFMDLKSESVGQLLMRRGRLPEDLALHYVFQVLGALDHLHKKQVLHLDIKADNVLLSEDGMNSFLCDFGHSEKLDSSGMSLNDQPVIKGTVTHMSPEVARGHHRGTKADVWSSSCMLLHMLSGCHPWTRSYSGPLCLKIANEPPPLKEIPPDCSHRTADVMRAGLQKDPGKRPSAVGLQKEVERALKEVGGLRSSVNGRYQEPLKKLLVSDSPSSPLHSTPPESQWMCPEKESEGEDEEDVEVSLSDSQAPPTQQHTRTPAGAPPAKQELEKLEKDLILISLSQPHSAEFQEQMLSCLSSNCHSPGELWEKKDSGRGSLGPGDDHSSGVFSFNSQLDSQTLSLGWLGLPHLRTPCWFDGVDVYIQDFNGRRLQIREKPRVNVGHIARGISDQISERAFSLQYEDGRLVSHAEEVQTSGLTLRCVSAPDCSQSWTWRIRKGVLETRN